MIETIKRSYKLLFEVRLLHHYWLDEGSTVFDLMTDIAKKGARLRAYDRRPFLEVTPTGATAKGLQALNCVYKDTAQGFLVATAGTQVIPDDALFEFIVTVNHSDFFNYTALTLAPQKISGFYSQAEDKVYRYKENVPVLSNLTGASRGAGSNKTLFLSSRYTALRPIDKVESLVVIGGALAQLTSDPPNPTTQQIGAQASHLPVFVHQDDVPAIVAPAGIAGAPERGIQLSGDSPDSVFALIRLSALRADDNDFSFIDGNGLAKKHYPVFQVRFKNRSTIRRYINTRTGAVVLTEPGPLPLTYFMAPTETKQKPSEHWVTTEKSGTKITRLISEIFVY